MKKILYVFCAILYFLPIIFNAQNVSLKYDKTNPQILYASSKLENALKENGYNITNQSIDNDYILYLNIDEDDLEKEAFSITPDKNEINILGGDSRGLIYGALALAESISNGKSLEEIKKIEEKPKLEFRGIKFNLPWETYRPSSALDQHYETCRSLDFWEAFLDMMVANRFNVISLWNMHPYTFMIKSNNFPEASPWSEEEMKEWESLYHEIFRLAKERALDTYIVHWNIFVSKEFADAHDVAKENYYPFYYVPGDTSQIIKQYINESITQTLNEYPNLDGIGVSHGEGMAGMTPLERQQWVDEVIIPGMLDADRKVKLIHRVPFSSGKSSEGGVSKNVEIITREAMEKLEDKFDGSIWVEMKFNWSHAHSTPKLEKVHGGKLGDTYFNPKPSNYKVVWQCRNEDFFALRWGVPKFIRDHISFNGTDNYVGGYFIGSETYIPALDYFTSIDKPVDWKYAFERQWLFYKLWGRLLYNPETSDEVFQNEFNRRYGKKGDNLLKAFSLASSTQLRFASLYNSTWDFTLYSEGFLALQGDSTKYISVDALINQPTMASEYISIKDYVEAILNGTEFSEGIIIPIKLAEMLELDNNKALDLVNQINTEGNTSLMYEVSDVKTWANLGLHLASKIRGTVDLYEFRLTGNTAKQKSAISHLEKALRYWDNVIEITRPIYKNMKLTHYNHNYFEANDNNLFHWALIREEVANDINIAKKSKKE